MGQSQINRDAGVAEKKARIALIPGSFDPITVGHLDLIERTASVFDFVCVAVMTNDMTKYVPDAKSKQYLFTREQRLELVRDAVSHLQNVTAIEDGGMLIDLFDRVGATAIVKGVRNAADFEYEQKHALYNRAHNHRAETLYLPADPAYDGVSSTLVRKLIEQGGDYSVYIPGLALPRIQSFLSDLAL